MSVSGYYNWLSRPPSARSIRHVWLTDLITEVHQASRGVYGSRRVHAKLRLGRGIVVGHGAVGTADAPRWHRQRDGPAEAAAGQAAPDRHRPGLS
ncbi:IS3 family transposase [Lentzea alba]|uniref:IS3 family transposase n=1 Tax=Lentzea alba TaxID=2714351 RepID=UPI0039BF8D2A